MELTTPFAESNSTLGDIIRNNARRTPNAPAIKSPGQVLTYATLDERTNRLAQGLLGSGHQPGDRISAWMEDLPEFIELLIAGAKAGIVIAPISKMFTPREALVQINDTEPDALAFTPSVAGFVEELGLGSAVRLYAAAGAPPVGDAIAISDLMSSGSVGAPPRRPSDELVMIAYTSGTTGNPKGSMYTHASVRNLLRLQSASYRLPLYGTAIFNSSMSFVGTITAFIWSHFYVGGSIVMATGLEVAEQLEIVEREHGTFMYLPTPAMEEFITGVQRRPQAIDSLVSVLHSGSKAPKERVERTCEVLGHRYLEGYGQTENSGGLIAATTAADAVGRSEAMDVFASGGRATIDTIVDIFDESGNPLPHDGTTVGELAYQSAGLMAGYWRNEAAFRDSMRYGWFRSGDIASMDPAGYVYIHDRRADLIVSGGANVSPTEVEDVVRTHPAVAECIVVAAPHDRWGQMVVAVVVPHAGATIDEEELRQHCRTRLASYKIPKRLLLRDAFQYSASHKVRRFQVRDWAEQQLEEGA